MIHDNHLAEQVQLTRTLKGHGSGRIRESLKIPNFYVCIYTCIWSEEARGEDVEIDQAALESRGIENVCALNENETWRKETRRIQNDLHQDAERSCKT